MIRHLHPLLATAERLRSGQLELVAYVEEVLARVESIDGQLGALLPEADMRARLLSDARALREIYPDPAQRPPLYGVPVGIKDLLRVDGSATRAGSLLPAEVFTGPQAACVSRLRAAGALILGKTATDEFAYADAPPTRNPHDLSRTPGGSSAGSAAAVAAGLCPLALGTQTSRSIIAPASFCGAVGFKPTTGRIPLDGVVLLSGFLDVVGTLTQEVAGARLAASVLFDDWSHARTESPEHAPATRPRIGVPARLLSAVSQLAPDRAWAEPLAGMRARLHALGYTVEDVTLGWDDDLQAVFEAAMTVLHGEMAELHEARFDQFGHLYRPVSQRGITRGRAVSQDALERARACGREVRREFNGWLESAGIDLLLCPSQIAPAPPLGGVTGYGLTTTHWSFAGAPCLSLPVCAIGGLPLGMQFIARRGWDEHLLTWGETLQRALGGPTGD